MSEGLSGLTIGHFGQFDPEYTRNRVIAAALRRAGATVVPIIRPGRWHRRALPLLTAARRERLDALVVGFPGHADVLSAQLATLGRRVPVIFDAFISVSDTTADRQGAPATGLKGRQLFLEDRWSCRLADLVLLDTEAHISFFSRTFGIPAGKFRRVWIGADEDLITLGSRPARGGFTVLFIGTFIPLQGVEHVLRAAHRLQAEAPDARFVLVGSGQTYPAARRLASDLALTNVEFVGRRRPDELSPFLSGADVCLGIFGSSGKAGRVIPNKAFMALAAARPLLTADTPAAREALEDGVHARLCPAADPDALAGALLDLRADEAGREAMAQRGHELYQERFSTAALARDLTAIVQQAVER